MFADVFDDFLDAAYLAGGRAECKAHIIASCRMAVNRGDDWREVLDSVRRNRPEFFCEREALRRQYKRYGKAGGQQPAQS